jgi:hypothetical protein
VPITETIFGSIIGRISSAKKQDNQNDQQYEAEAIAAIAKMGRHVAGVAAKERKHHEYKNDDKQDL